jgi:methionine sulfoxide reductase heme-binding subunit
MISSVNVAWYVARAGGLVSFGLLTLAVLAGVLLAGRARLAGWPRFAVEDIHRFLGLLAGSFLCLHLVGLLADGYLGLPLSALVVPGLSSYRPLATALGVVGAELLLALAVTNRLRRRLAYSTWRRLHLLNFAVWVLALGHGIAAGTDSDTRWAIAVYLLASGSVAAACVWRLLRAHQAPAWAVAIWTGTASIVAAELVLALAVGPLARP